MATNYEFGRGLINGAEQKELVVGDLERMVRFAAEPVIPGETVKEQIRNASKALKIDFGTVRRCWYGLASTGVYPTVYNAWARLVEERSRSVSGWARNRATGSDPQAPRPRIQSAMEDCGWSGRRRTVSSS